MIFQNINYLIRESVKQQVFYLLVLGCLTVKSSKTNYIVYRLEFDINKGEYTMRIDFDINGILFFREAVTKKTVANMTKEIESLDSIEGISINSYNPFIKRIVGLAVTSNQEASDIYAEIFAVCQRFGLDMLYIDSNVTYASTDTQMHDGLSLYLSETLKKDYPEINNLEKWYKKFKLMTKSDFIFLQDELNYLCTNRSKISHIIFITKKSYNTKNIPDEINNHLDNLIMFNNLTYSDFSELITLDIYPESDDKNQINWIVNHNLGENLYNLIYDFVNEQSQIKNFFIE